jgi:hypothetical protein
MNGPPLSLALCLRRAALARLSGLLTEFRIRLACNALIESVMQFVLDWIRIGFGAHPLCMPNENEIEKKFARTHCLQLGEKRELRSYKNATQHFK